MTQIQNKITSKTILGIDPGTRKAGYCVIQLAGANTQSLKILEWGVWNLNDRLSLGERLEILFTEASSLLKKWNPQIVGLEKAVVFKSVPSALTLSEARGVLRLAIYSELAEASQRLVELSPTLIKKSTTGRGLATKEEIKRSLGFRWGLNFASETLKNFSADAFDALAIATSAALVHNRQHGLKTRPQIFSSRKRTQRLDVDAD
ncbi:MAG: crossover junction endodeoxyribonuclease RuvC [bacterium]